MSRKKEYRVTAERISALKPLSARINQSSQPVPRPDSTCIDIRALLGEQIRCASGYKTQDLAEWLGRGIDAWVWSGVAALRSLLLSGSRETSTIVAFSRKIPLLFRYLTQDHPFPRQASSPSGLRPEHVEQFADWLQKQAQLSHWSTETTRNAFKCVKAVLLEMF